MGQSAVGITPAELADPWGMGLRQKMRDPSTNSLVIGLSR